MDRRPSEGLKQTKTYNWSSMNRKPDFLCPLTNLLWKKTFNKASVSRLHITAPFGPNFLLTDILLEETLFRYFVRSTPFKDLL